MSMVCQSWMCWRTEGASTTFEGSRFQSLINFWERKFLLMLIWDDSLYNMNWYPRRPWSLEASVKNLDDSISSLPVIMSFNQVSSFSSLLQSCTVQDSQSISTAFFRTLTHLVALCRTFSRISIFLTIAGLYAWTQYSKCGLRYVLQSMLKSSFSIFGKFRLIILRTDCALFAALIHLVMGLMSDHTPM